MDLIIGKIAIWIGIVVQICYNVVIVSMTIWTKYSKDGSTDENEKVDIESTENQFESIDKTTKE
ncbi:hypothetical protein PU976_01105 [Staphylococcus aureus]|nr:hypothetical protein PU976_01105 [Staphylococcus aureus]